LELSYNPIGFEGVKSLFEVLKFHGKIKSLKLGWCQVFIPPFSSLFFSLLKAHLDNNVIAFKCGTVFLVV
jgi:hypothetical protein